MIVPNNTIQTGKYTSGNEFVYKLTNAFYQGYYYILDNLYYPGKDFDPNAPELVPISQSNTLLNNPKTAVYAFSTNKTSADNPQYVNSIPSVPTGNTRYFFRKINVFPITIKEINKDTYNQIQNDPLYQTTYIGNGQTINQADTQLPGLKTWLLG
jgi:hypothetical protein